LCGGNRHALDHKRQKKPSKNDPETLITKVPQGKPVPPYRC
jgi:hypothetical protein